MNSFTRKSCGCCGHTRDPLKAANVLCDSGFKKREILICEECQKDRNNKTEEYDPTLSFEFKGYEGLMRVIKKECLPEGQDGYGYSINFYDAAKRAFNRSYSFREYLKYFGVDNANKIDKNLKPLWPFVYRIARRQEPRIYISAALSNKDHGNLVINWVRDAEENMTFDWRMVQDFIRDEGKPIKRD